MRPGDAVFQGQEGLPTWAVTLIRASVVFAGPLTED